MSKLAIRVWSAEVQRLEALLLVTEPSAPLAAAYRLDLDQARQALEVEGGLKHVRETGSPTPAADAVVAPELTPEARVRLGFAELAEDATPRLADRVIEALAPSVEGCFPVERDEHVALAMAEAAAKQLADVRQQLALSRTALEIIQEDGATAAPTPA